MSETVDQYIARIKNVGQAAPQSVHDELQSFDLDSNVFTVLTEYEEYRSRSCVNEGLLLFRLRARFPLSDIDESIDGLKESVGEGTEIITYLPNIDGDDPDAIELDVLLASSVPYVKLREVLGDRYGPLTAVAKRQQVSTVLFIRRLELVEQRCRLLRRVHRILRRNVRRDDRRSTLRSVSNTVRVDIGKLDSLMGTVGELALIRSAIGAAIERLRTDSTQREVISRLLRIDRSFERQLEELQAGILDVRMVPLGQVFNKLARVVRQFSRENGKLVNLVVTGADTEMDKLMVEELSDPLMHLIRNAIDHGVESPEVRALAKKPETGTLAVNAFQKGSKVIIEIEDDGAGIDANLLKETAVRKNLITEHASQGVSKQEALELIFVPGLSTSETVTDISGRGVGMDVVRTNIRRLGGTVEVQSELGTGTKFVITLPTTLAIIRALVIRLADRLFALPITSVREAAALNGFEIRKVEGRPMISLRGASVPICDLGEFFGVRSGGEPRYLVVAEVGKRRLAMMVDGIEGQRDLIIKSLGNSLAHVRGFAGATDLGDQRVALVIDAPAVLNEVYNSYESASRTGVNV
ncbi:MAG: chemotaxis protein CheA [Polyangiales bacterium]